MIKPCKSCKPHAFQDGKYGDKNRVMNPDCEEGPADVSLHGLRQGIFVVAWLLAVEAVRAVTALIRRRKKVQSIRGRKTGSEL